MEDETKGLVHSLDIGNNLFKELKKAFNYDKLKAINSNIPIRSAFDWKTVKEDAYYTDDNVKNGDKILVKRQILPSGDSQMMIGTFQAMIRPMLFPGAGQNTNKEEETNAKLLN